ncbi:hypothetical protein, partial [Neisseria gonorrhoeae]
GPWVTGVLYDHTLSYTPGFVIAFVGAFVSAAAVWIAAPRRVRLVAGQLHRLKTVAGTAA